MTIISVSGARPHAVRTEYDDVRGSSRDSDALVRAAKKRLAQSSIGAEIVQGLRKHAVPIDVLSDDIFYAKYTDGIRGLFDPRTGRITVPISSMVDPAQGAIMLAHEGTHAVEWHSHRGGRVGAFVREITLGVWAAAQAPLHLANPVTAAVDSGRRRAVDGEVRAYTVQARVADALGVQAYGLADFGHNDDGTMSSEEQVRARIEQVPIYQERGTMRTVRAGATAVFLAGISLSAAEGVAMLTHRRLPTVPVYAAAGAAAVMLTAHDWITHRDT